MHIGRRKKQIRAIKTTLFFVCPLKKVSLFSCPSLTIVWIIAEKGLEANFLIIQKKPNMLKKKKPNKAFYDMVLVIHCCQRREEGRGACTLYLFESSTLSKP